MLRERSVRLDLQPYDLTDLCRLLKTVGLIAKVVEVRSGETVQCSLGGDLKNGHDPGAPFCWIAVE